MLDLLKKSIAAGCAIAVGSVIYLSLENKIAGAILFSVGLFLICSYGMMLFTGKIGYVLDNKNNPNCLVIWIGNLIGTLISCIAVRFARPALTETASVLVTNKLAQSPFQTMILAFFCGMLMYAAVENFRRHPHEVSGIFGVVMCVSGFILCGFEHSIADMCYFIIGVGSPSLLIQSIVYILLVSVFNGIGSLALKYLLDSSAK